MAANRKWRTTRFCLLIGLLLAHGCGGSAPPNGPSTVVTVFAAASLAGPFKDIALLFESRYPGSRVVLNFAASQQLAQQLAQGAPAGVFASASQKPMDVTVRAGRVGRDAVRLFAHNRLVVIFPYDNPGQIKDLRDLARPGLHLVLAAREVPAGEYALEMLDKAGRDPSFGMGFRDAVLRNVASYEENVKAVLIKVTLGEGDAGIVYASDVPGDNTARLGRLDLPARLNVVANYVIAPVHGDPHPELAQAFVSLVLSREGQGILVQHGLSAASGVD